MEFLLTIFSRYAIRLFSPTPQIKKEGGLLVMESTWKTALLSLGSRHRRVSVDPKNEGVFVTDRRFWLFNASRRIPFDAIASVFYCYQDVASGMFSHYDQDLFSVGLNLFDGQHLTLFRFYGQGEFTNMSVWPDWCYWEENFIGMTAPTDIESESAQLADVLCHLTGAPLTNDL